MITCPGCGLELPDDPSEVSPRPGASAGCWRLYGEVQGFEAQHLVEVGRFHQMLVDTYSAHHPAKDGPPIGLAFALIGLHLALDQGWRGDEVRSVHRALAATRRDWPRFERSCTPASLTVFDLALAETPARYCEVLQSWASAVWASWEEQRAAVRQLLADRLPAEQQIRIRAG
jgi:hypothetical protein